MLSALSLFIFYMETIVVDRDAPRVLVDCWGATMRIVDFYLVVGETPTYLKIQKLKKENMETGHQE